MTDFLMMLEGVFIEPFTYTFMQRAFVVGMVTALVCGLISCFLVLIGWSLMGDAISHSVLPGVVIAYILQIPFVIGALAFALLAVSLIGGIRKRREVKSDAAIGIVFTTLFALGTVLVSVTPSQINLNHILFGNLLGVIRPDMIQVLILGAIVALYVLIKRRDLALFAFDPMQARAVGISPKRLSFGLLVSLALTVVVSFQAVGVILVVAMLITPGAVARLCSKSLWKMLWISPVVAAVAVYVGILFSYGLDTSTGGMIGIVLGIEFGVVFLFGPQGVVVDYVHYLLRTRARSAAKAGDEHAVSVSGSSAPVITADSSPANAVDVPASSPADSNTVGPDLADAQFAVTPPLAERSAP